MLKKQIEKIDDVVKVKEDFLNYVNAKIPKIIEDYLQKELESFKKEILKLDDEILKYYSLITYEKSTLPIFENIKFDFEDILSKNLSKTEKEQLENNMNNIFLSTLPEKLSGIVIIGISKKV